MSVAATPEEVPEREILKAVERTGMRAQVWREASEEAEPQGVWCAGLKNCGA